MRLGKNHYAEGAGAHSPNKLFELARRVRLFCPLNSAERVNR